MYYVYLIESLAAQGQRYVGMTAYLKKRLQEKQRGKIPSYVKIQAMEASYLYRIHRSGQGRRFRAQSQI
jgi:predicted GIY-YIG superfamily endonuclease